VLLFAQELVRSIACGVISSRILVILFLLKHFFAHTLARTHQLADTQEHHIARTNVERILIRLEDSSVTVVLNIFRGSS